MQRTALYPGTFDPITQGHTEMIQRAAGLFDRVIVAVAANPGKRPVFSHVERIRLAQLALAPLITVEVRGFDQLLVHFARQCGAQVLVRGLRAVSDFEYEFQLAAINRQLAPELETVLLPAAEHYTFISSSMVREVAQLGGDVTPYVHPAVLAALKQRYGGA